MRFSLKPWNKIKVERDMPARRALLNDAAQTGKRAFLRGIDSAKSGIHHASLPRRSSAAGEYPANQSGRLRNSVYDRVRTNESEIGSRTHYVGFLKDGTRFMSPRSMSNKAMSKIIPEVLARAKPHTRFTRVR